MEEELENMEHSLEQVRTDTEREIEGLSLVEMKAKLQEAYVAENAARSAFEGLDLNHEPGFQVISQRRAVIEKLVQAIEPQTGEVSL